MTSRSKAVPAQLDAVAGATEADAIAALAVAAAGRAEILTTAKGREFLILPDGGHHDVSEPNAVDKIMPGHIAQAVTLQTSDSLADYVNRFATPQTLLLADIDQDLILAAVDYHGPAEAGHLDHRAVLRLPRSMEWKTWADVNGKLMGQLEFARFLEENAADIVEPSAADLLEACRDLHAVRRVNFTKAVRTSTDNESFEYTDETEARTRGGVDLPTKFQLSIPVYFGGRYVELYAFLRWKLDDGQLTLGVRLHRPEHVRQAMFQEIVRDLAVATSRPAVFGRLGG
jgi:uncharacterized protein YfdQ (DUF2303 family)